MKFHILLTEPIDPVGIGMMRQIAQVDIAPNPREETIASMIGNYDALVIRATRLTEAILAAGQRLKIVSRHGVGQDNLDIPAATRHGVLLTTTPGANAHSVAEHTVGAICYLLKRYVQAEKLLRSGAFQQPGSLTGLLTRLGFENEVLEGKTLALAGVGAIARRVAFLCGSGFGMRVIGYDPYVGAEEMDRLGITRYDTVAEMLPVCDVLSIHVPRTPETLGLINRGALAMMKPSAVVINTARGGIVDESALVEALRAGRIAGAALDVYETEPPAVDSPLFTLDNVLLTPHIAAATDGAMRNMSSCAAQNVIDCLEDRKPRYMLNPEVWRPAR